MSIGVRPTAQRTLTEEVAEEIRVAMLRRRVTGARLAKELGVSPAWISYRLTGAQPIDLNDLDRIATALGVKIADLLPRSRREVTVTDPPSPVETSRPPGQRPGSRGPFGGRPGNRSDLSGPRSGRPRALVATGS